jgi:branched-chain amino acid transport system substrate-binding protein
MGLKNWIAGIFFVSSIATSAPEIAYAQAKEPLLLGGTFSTTGPVSFLGDPEQKAVDLWVKKTNEEGGINGRKIKFTWYDDGGDARKATANVRRLINDDKITVLVGGSTTGATMAIVPIVEDAKIPFVSVAGGTVITTPPKKWVFASSYTDRLVIEGLFAEFKAKNLSKVGLLSGPGGFDQSCRSSAKALAPSFGLTISSDQLHGDGDTDMTAQFLNIKDANVDAVLYCGFGTPTSIVARNHKRLAIKQPLYMTTGAASKQFIKGADGAAQGVKLGVSAVLVSRQLPSGHPQKAVTEEFVKLYSAAGGGEVSLFAAAGYDAGLIIGDALARADSTNPEKIRDAMETIKGLKAIDGTLNMSPENHLGLDASGLMLVEVDGDDFKLLK